MLLDWARLRGLVIALGSLAGAVVAVGTVWSLLELPVPASRSWVHQTIHQYEVDSVTLLYVRRQLNYAELFQWQSNKEQNDSIKLNIERLKGEIAAIDHELATRH